MQTKTELLRGAEIAGPTLAILAQARWFCSKRLSAADLGLDAARGGRFREPTSVEPFSQVMPIGTPGEPVAPTIGTGLKT